MIGINKTIKQLRKGPAKRLPMQICANEECEAIFERPASSPNWRKYCSDECRRAELARQRREKREQKQRDQMESLGRLADQIRALG